MNCSSVLQEKIQIILVYGINRPLILQERIQITLVYVMNCHLVLLHFYCMSAICQLFLVLGLFPLAPSFVASLLPPSSFHPLSFHHDLIAH